MLANHSFDRENILSLHQHGFGHSPWLLILQCFIAKDSRLYGKVRAHSLVLFREIVCVRLSKPHLVARFSSALLIWSFCLHLEHTIQHFVLSFADNDASPPLHAPPMGSSAAIAHPIDLQAEASG